MSAFAVLVALALTRPAAAPLASELQAAHALASRQLIVQLARPTFSRPGIAAVRSTLVLRCETLGIRAVGALDDRLPAANGSARTVSTAIEREGLDPARVWLLEAPDAVTATTALDALARDPEIDWVEPNHLRWPAVAIAEAASIVPDDVASTAVLDSFPNDPMFRDSRQWGLRNRGPGSAYGGVAGADVHALEGWSWSRGANDVLLAVADTGIDPNHPELETPMPGGGPRLVHAINVTSDPSGAVRDSFGHGTAVTGVFGALTNNGALQDSLGVAGVCGGDGGQNRGCRIVPIKITPNHVGFATTYDISRAILHATRVGARAMNLSFGGLSPSRLERLALMEAITHGCVVVAAAGNFAGINGGVDPVYPAAYAAQGLCIQVGATDPFDRRASFSSRGPGLDLMAPGVNVWTTAPTYATYHGALYNGFLPISGTSLAAPFVTGAVGLLAAMRPELIDTDFQHVLRESADDIGAPGVDSETGHGRMNLGRALASVRSTMGIWHDEVAAQTLTPRGADTLVVGEVGFGNLHRARDSGLAQLIEASATVAIPDSFLDSVRVWTRVGGTTTMRGDFRAPYFAPWAEVAGIDAASFTIRGYAYRLLGCLLCTVPEDAEVPLPADQTRFGFTVIGRVDRPPLLRVRTPAPGTPVAEGEMLEVSWDADDPDRVSAIELEWQAPGRRAVRIARLPGEHRHARIAAPCENAALRVIAIDEHGRHHDRSEVVVPIERTGVPCAMSSSAPVAEPRPNPFRGETRLEIAQGSRPVVVDVAGRLVRRLHGAERVAVWDGRHENGRRAAQGLYFVRWSEGQRVVERKVVKIE